MANGNLPMRLEKEIFATAAPDQRTAAGERVHHAIYTLALFVSITVWFIAIRAPLWLDETGSYQQINAGFSGIPSRQGLSTPAYSYILWFCTKIIGKSEIALRVPEILAMLGAVYLLYCAAQELFDRDVAIIAAVVFCLHPIVVFAAIDVRPYAFAALAINAAILCLVRLRCSNSNWLAALFGISSASIVYFHFLFAVMLPALAIGYFLVKKSSPKAIWRQFGIALTAFVLAFLPVIPWLHLIIHTPSSTHVVDGAPTLSNLAWTLASRNLLCTFVAAAFIAATTRRLELPSHSGWRILVCASLGLIPILILFGVSTETSIHVFVARYQLVAVPGIALAGRCRSVPGTPGLSGCCSVSFSSQLLLTSASPTLTQGCTATRGNMHWKQRRRVPPSIKDPGVGMQSYFCFESDFMPMPVGSAIKDSGRVLLLYDYKLQRRAGCAAAAGAERGRDQDRF